MVDQLDAEPTLEAKNDFSSLEDVDYATGNIFPTATVWNRYKKGNLK